MIGEKKIKINGSKSTRGEGGKGEQEEEKRDIQGDEMKRSDIHTEIQATREDKRDRKLQEFQEKVSR